jgi:hypothetical protein
MKTPQQVTSNYVRGTLLSFLDGKKSLNWFLGIVKSSGVKGANLKEVLENRKGYGDQKRYQEAFSACQERDWFEEPQLKK